MPTFRFRTTPMGDGTVDIFDTLTEKPLGRSPHPSLQARMFACLAMSGFTVPQLAKRSDTSESTINRVLWFDYNNLQASCKSSSSGQTSVDSWARAFRSTRLDVPTRWLSGEMPDDTYEPDWYTEYRIAKRNEATAKSSVVVAEKQAKPEAEEPKYKFDLKIDRVTDTFIAVQQSLNEKIAQAIDGLFENNRVLSAKIEQVTELLHNAIQHSSARPETYPDAETDTPNVVEANVPRVGEV